jgi:HD-GYP domain-containing protein (c-di-GMP phosphodiesterase class II)
MTTLRPYRPPLSPSVAVTELRAGGGTQFDPRVVVAACSVLARDLPEVDGVVPDVIDDPHL